MICSNYIIQCLPTTNFMLFVAECFLCLYTLHSTAWIMEDTPLSLEEQARKVLSYVIPFISVITLPLTLFNFYILLRQNALYRASHFLYLNLVVMDTLNCLAGIMMAEYLHDNSNIDALQFAEFIVLMIFNGEIILLFGLSVIRMLALKLSAATVMSVLKFIAYIIAAISWSTSIGILIHTYLKSMSVQYHFNLGLIMTILVIITGIIYLYIIVSVWYRSSVLYTRAYTTSLLIFIGFTLCYIYFIFLYFYHVFLNHSKKTCDPLKWISVFSCLRSAEFIGFFFLLTQGLANNLILIGQKEVRGFLSEKMRYYRDVVLEWRYGYETIE